MVVNDKRWIFGCGLIISPVFIETQIYELKNTRKQF